MRFQFGDSNDTSVCIDAENLEQAIKIFKVSELFPEKYVSNKFWKKDKGGYYDREYDNDLHRYTVNFKPNPKIFIYDDDRKKIGEVALEDCLSIDFRSILPAPAGLLEAPAVSDDTPTEEVPSNLPVIGSEQAVRAINQKQVLREHHDALMRKKAELENLMRDVNKSLDVLHKELKQKRKLLQILEIYAGVNEAVWQLCEGAKAPEGENVVSPLCLYQQVLYMDEETGIWDEEENREGLDFENIEKFDEWISKRYKNYLYEPLSVCVFRVRRSRKDYGDLWSNVFKNIENSRSYFLIRNGDNLYRVWANTPVGERLFPTSLEYNSIYQEYKKWGEDRLKEKINDAHEGYLFGLLAIQGIIDRSEILGTALRGHINLMRPDGIPEQWIKLIRDDEPEHFLDDGKLPWREFIKKNRESIVQGTRIIITKPSWYFRMDKNSKDGNDLWRCDPHPGWYTPSNKEVYTVEENEKSSHGTNVLKILFLPKDDRWDPKIRDYKPRTKSIPFRLYKDEVLNFDEVSLEDAKYYETNRLYRREYLDILPALHYVKIVRKEELKLEEEFIKYIAGQLHWEESRYSEIRKAVAWWKLKNKWKRALTTDEAKAVRMILRKLKGMDDL